MIGASAHSVLEAFAATDRSTSSILLYACCTSGSRAYWHTRACLASVGRLHVVCPLGHAHSGTRFELLDRLSVSNANGRLVLGLGLLVSAISCLLLLLLIHVCARVECTSRPRICRLPRSCARAWLLDLVLCLVSVSRSPYAHCGACFLLLLVALVATLCRHNVTDIVLIRLLLRIKVSPLPRKQSSSITFSIF